jgi:hypothetical protein
VDPDPRIRTSDKQIRVRIPTDPTDLDADSEHWFFKDKKSQRSCKTVVIKVFLTIFA